jgi:hypothetical protein
MSKRDDLEALLRAALPLEEGPEATVEELRGWIGEDVELIGDLDDLRAVWTVVGALRDPATIRVVDASVELAARFQEKLEPRRSA